MGWGEGGVGMLELEDVELRFVAPPHAVAVMRHVLVLMRRSFPGKLCQFEPLVPSSSAKPSLPPPPPLLAPPPPTSPPQHRETAK